MEKILVFDIMSIETEPEVKGKLVKNQTLITDSQMKNTLENSGYGELHKKKFFLQPFESLYLLFCKKLVLFRGKGTLDFDSLMQICIKHDENILTKFLIYRDLRSRGYIVKDGFGFGSDFRIYDRGHFGEKGAKFLVFGMSEGKQEKVGNLQKKVEQITKMGKEPIVAVIERRGEVIYYKISKINFLENKSNLNMGL